MDKEATIRYSNEEVTVLWKPRRCIHSTKCWKGLPSVFKPREKPWIIADGAEARRVIDQVHKCPSGALSIEGDPLSAR